MSLVSKNRETEQNRKKRVNDIASEVTGSSTSYSVHPLGQKIDREAPGVSPNVFLSSTTQGLWILLPQCLGVASPVFTPTSCLTAMSHPFFGLLLLLCCQVAVCPLWENHLYVPMLTPDIDRRPSWCNLRDIQEVDPS